MSRPDPGRARIAGGLLVALAALVLAACGGSGESKSGAAAAAPAAELTDLAGVLDLRAAFNADRGSPRLLVLLSPT